MIPKQSKWFEIGAMKKLVKKIIPASVWVSARETYSKLCLNTVPAHLCDTKNLRPAAALSIDHIFSDPAIEQNWEDDHAAIINLYSNEDTMEGVNPGDRRALYYLISQLKPEAVLEIGTHIGASTLHIAMALKRAGKKGVVTSVDIYDVNHPEYGAWKRIGLSDSPRGFAEQLSCLGCIDFRTAPCLDFMHPTDRKYDFIFLDGDHSAQAVYKEVSAALSILAPNGIILLHDYYPDARPLFLDGNIISGPFCALKRIGKENPDVQAIPLGTLPWPTKQGSHKTSLALVGKK